MSFLSHSVYPRLLPKSKTEGPSWRETVTDRKMEALINTSTLSRSRGYDVILDMAVQGKLDFRRVAGLGPFDSCQLASFPFNFVRLKIMQGICWGRERDAK